MNTLEQGGAAPAIAQAQAPILEAHHLRKVFPVGGGLFRAARGVQAVEDTSLSLYPGRATALVGESGSGKTTVARMLALLYTPTSGTIAFQGKPVNVNSRRALHAYRRQ